MTQDSPSRKLDQYIVRFPDGMRDRLKELAAHNNRSLNAEIVARLERSLESLDDEAKSEMVETLEAKVAMHEREMIEVRNVVTELKEFVKSLPNLKNAE